MNKRRTANAAAAGVAAAATITVGVATAPASAPAPACESYPDARTADVVRELRGPILQHYLAAGGPGNIHGLPTSNETPTSPEQPPLRRPRGGFVNGTTIVDTRSGETSSAYWERGS